MAATDLTDLAAVRRFLQKPAGDVNQDAVISEMITHASGLILRSTERELAPKTDTPTARVFEYPGGEMLDLAPYDARTVTQVRHSFDNATWTTLGAEDWRLYPYPATDGVYTALRINPVSWSTTSVHWRERLIEVTGTWGWPAVPTEAVLACKIAVATWLRANVQAFSTTFSIDEGRLERPEALPSAAVRMLERLNRNAGVF